jgi:hypothetical protein
VSVGYLLYECARYLGIGALRKPSSEGGASLRCSLPRVPSQAPQPCLPARMTARCPCRRCPRSRSRRRTRQSPSLSFPNRYRRRRSRSPQAQRTETSTSRFESRAQARMKTQLAARYQPVQVAISRARVSTRRRRRPTTPSTRARPARPMRMSPCGSSARATMRPSGRRMRLSQAPTLQVTSRASRGRRKRYRQTLLAEASAIPISITVQILSINSQMNW